MKWRIWIVIPVTILLFLSGCTQQTPQATPPTNASPSIWTYAPPTGSQSVDISAIPIIDQGSDEWRSINASNIARIALEDSRAQQLLHDGGKIVGLLFTSGPTPKSDPTPIVGPALRIDHGEVHVDFQVDESEGAVVRTITAVPSGSHVESLSDTIQVTRNGEILLRMNKTDSTTIQS